MIWLEYCSLGIKQQSLTHYNEEQQSIHLIIFILKSYHVHYHP
jgi:hypothetical protein